MSWRFFEIVFLGTLPPKINQKATWKYEIKIYILLFATCIRQIIGFCLSVNFLCYTSKDASNDIIYLFLNMAGIHGKRNPFAYGFLKKNLVCQFCFLNGMSERHLGEHLYIEHNHCRFHKITFSCKTTAFDHLGTIHKWRHPKGGGGTYRYPQKLT